MKTMEAKAMNEEFGSKKNEQEKATVTCLR